MLWRRQPIERLIANPATPDPLREQLRLVQDVREYGRAIGLSVGEQYTSYVEWPGDRVVTTVVATRPGEVEAAGFRFPIIGRVPYKGFFDRDRAEREAAALRERGLDVCVVPVAAYSTLGWLADPVTEPMLRSDDLELVETLLHELVHATAYIASDAEFSESVASFIGREAAARYLAERGVAHQAKSPVELAAEQRARTADARRLARRLRTFRQEVETLYDATEVGATRDEQRRTLEDRLRAQLQRLPLQRSDRAELAAAIQLGDACLALRGTYSDDIADHERVLAALGGDLTGFIARLSGAAAADAPREAFFGAAP